MGPDVRLCYHRSPYPSYCGPLVDLALCIVSRPASRKITGRDFAFPGPGAVRQQIPVCAARAMREI